MVAFVRPSVPLRPYEPFVRLPRKCLQYKSLYDTTCARFLCLDCSEILYWSLRGLALSYMDSFGHLMSLLVFSHVYDQVNKVGIFTEIGPLSCFISRHSIPADMDFDPNSNPPCYKTKDEDIVIQTGSFYVRWHKAETQEQ